LNRRVSHNERRADCIQSATRRVGRHISFTPRDDYSINCRDLGSRPLCRHHVVYVVAHDVTVRLGYALDRTIVTIHISTHHRQMVGPVPLLSGGLRTHKAAVQGYTRFQCKGGLSTGRHRRAVHARRHPDLVTAFSRLQRSLQVHIGIHPGKPRVGAFRSVTIHVKDRSLGANRERWGAWQTSQAGKQKDHRDGHVTR